MGSLDKKLAKGLRELAQMATGSQDGASAEVTDVGIFESAEVVSVDTELRTCDPVAIWASSRW